MADGGEVTKHAVLGVLGAHEVEVHQQESNGDVQVSMLARRDAVLSIKLYDQVGRQVLHKLARKFDIPIHHFYHPEMAPLPPNTPIN